MTEMSSRPIRQRQFARQTTEPQGAADGFLWVNPEGGSAGGNSERYYWNGNADTWELDSSVGPDTPLYPVAGAQWRDTAAAEAKQYDGAAWQPMGVTDHGLLDGLVDDDHGQYATDTKVDNHVADSAAHHNPVTVTTGNRERLNQATNTSGTHASFSLPGFHFELAWLRITESVSSTSSNEARTQLEIEYADGVTETLTVSQQYTGSDGSGSSFTEGDLSSSSYITAGISTIRMKWNNQSVPDAGTVDHYWMFRGWQQ